MFKSLFKSTVVSTSIVISLLSLIPNAKANHPRLAFVQKLTVGDRACYADVLDSTGKVTTEFAHFDICKQDLIGKPVQLSYQMGQILAAECEGDFSCDKADTITIITKAVVLIAPTEKEAAWESYWNSCGKGFMSKEKFTNFWRPVFEEEWNRSGKKPSACG